MHAIADQLEPDNTVKTCFCHVALIVYLVYLGENKELFCSVLLKRPIVTDDKFYR